jgi:hypothetical protein
MSSSTTIIAMITSLTLRNKSIYILLILIVFSSCHSTRQVVCPEIDTDHPKARRFNRHFSLAWNHSRKKSKKSIFIKPVQEISDKHEYENDMTLLESKSGEKIISAGECFSDLEPVTPGYRNTLVASSDETLTRQAERVVFDGISRFDQLSNPPSKKEVREIKREIRKEMRNALKNTDTRRLFPEDTIMLFAVTSFVMGIIGIFTMPLLLGLLATIFGAIALSMIRREGVQYGRGLALAGLILGIVLMVVGLILLPFAILSIFI